MADATTRASQVKSHVMALKSCESEQRPKTLQEVREERAKEHVPLLPDRDLAPPPPNYQEMVPP